MDYSIAQEDSFKLVRSSANQGVHIRGARLLGNVIFYALLAMIALAAIPYGTVQPQWEAVFECTVFALVALWIIEGLLKGVWHVSGRRLLMPLGALVILAFLQSLSWKASAVAGIEGRYALSADPYETRLFAFQLLALALTLGLLMRYTSSEHRLRALIYTVIGVGVASAIFGFVRETSQSGESGFLLPYLKPGTGYGQFINRNHFAFLMEMSLGLTLGLVAGGGVRRNRLLLYIAAIVPMWTTLVLSNSRGGILSMLGQLIFIALLFKTVRPRQESTNPHQAASGRLQRLVSSSVVRVALVVCLVVVVAVGIVWVGGDTLVSRLEIVPGEISEEGGLHQGERRIEIWRATWQMIKAHPVTGVGFGGYATAISKYHAASGEVMPQQAHNDYLELLASGGLIGLALGAWFVVSFVGPARRQLRSTNSFRRAACFGALAGIFGVAIHSLIDFGLHVTVNAIVFNALVVVATVRREGDKGKERDAPA
jgi:O-antigen ligase